MRNVYSLLRGGAVVARSICFLVAALLGGLPLAGPALAQTTPAWQSAVVPMQTTAAGTAITRATAVDAATGAVFVTGSFTGQVAFGSTVLVSAGNSDVFVARYEPATATWAWAQRGGGTNADIGYGIAADGQGGVYVTGQFDTSGTFAGQPALSGTDDEVFVAAYAAADGVGRWATSGGGTGSDAGLGIAADGQGGVYVTGQFATSGTFAGQPALAGTGVEMFVAAYAASNGTGRWAKSGGGPGGDIGYGVAADGSGGVYVTGQFATSGTFAGQPALAGTGVEMFVAAYAATNGTGRWAKSGGGASIDVGNAIATDGSGGVYVTGGFTTTATFAGQPALSGTSYEVFVAAYAAADGTGRWAKSGGGPSADFGNGIATDGSSGVYVTGYFTTSGTFAGQPALSGTGQEAFMAAYAAADGTGRWATSGGGAGNDAGYGIAAGAGSVYAGIATGTGAATLGSTTVPRNAAALGTLNRSTGAWQGATACLTAAGTAQVRATAVDAATGAAFVTGFFNGQVAFGSTVLVSAGGYDVFVARYEPATSTWAWAQRGGGMGDDFGNGIVADGQGGVYMTGNFESSGIFAGQPALSGINYNMVVAAYAAANGTGRWAKSGGGNGDDFGRGIAVDGQGGVYVTGTFVNNGTFAGQPALSGTGNEVFVAAYAATDGTGRWATSGGGAGDDISYGIAADGQGGVYITGAFTTSGTFAGQPALSGTGQEAFVAAYAATTGAGRWATSGGGASADYGYGIAADGLGGVYVTGTFTTSGTFAGQPALSGTGQEVFVAAYAATTGAGRWARSGGSPGTDMGQGIAADGQGGVYVTGYFNSSGTFAGQPALSGTGADVFVAAYAAADGTGRWAKSGGGTHVDYGYAIATNGSRLYVGGYVGLPATFDAITLAGTNAPVGLLASLILPPSLVSLLPASGAAGSTLGATGGALSGLTAVTFTPTGGGAATAASGYTSTATTASGITVPAGLAPGTYTLAVTNANGTSNGLPFTVTAATIDITSFTPASGPIGTSVTITGSGFSATAAQNVVFFGATQAAVMAASPTSLTATVPLGAIYQYVTVTNLATHLTAYADKPFGVTLVGAATFQPKVDFGTGVSPLTVTSGDLNGDGRADLVAVNTNDHTVSVLRNTSTAGTVSFAAKVDFATGQYPVLVAIGDLDGDGKPDLAVTNENSGSVSVLRNTSAAGAVSFAPRVDINLFTTLVGVVIGDVDGDGKPDLVVADFSNANNVVVLRNTSTVGAVSFAAPVYFGTGDGPYAVTLGDVNADGLPDVVVTNYTANTVSVLRNTSTPGTVSLAARITYGFGFLPNAVALGDLDADGLPDLAITNSGGNTVSVLHNTSAAGAVSFAPLVDYTVGNRPHAVAIGDVDGDGQPDLAVANPGSVYVLRNTSVPGTISLVTQAIVAAGAGARSVVIGDLDGDGKPDLATANETANTVSVLRQQLQVRGLYISQGTLSPAFATGTMAYTASVGNAVSSVTVAADVSNPLASYTVNGMVVTNGTASGPIALAVGSNVITIVVDFITYTITVTRAAAPTLSSLSPTSGPVGTSVTLTGSDLTGAVEVDFTGAAGITTGLTVSGSGSSQTITVTVPARAITGPVTVATPNGTTNGLTFTVTYPDLVISTGTTAAPIAVAAGTYNSITVTNTGYATLDGAVVVNSVVSISGSLDTSCQPLTGSASFTLAAGATLTICDANGISPSGSSGAVQTTGTRSFSTDASYVYTATQAQSTGTGLPATVRNLTAATSGGDLFLTLPVAIRQLLALPTASNFNLNNQALTLLSDASGTALVANTGGGQVLGNTATLQRHIETNTAANGYRHYASPMVATAGAETLATLATAGYAPNFNGTAAYNSSATPSLVTPFPTVFRYNQDRIAGLVSNYDTFSKGWQASPDTEVPQVGRGYSVQAPGAALIDFTGQLSSGSVSRANLQRSSTDAATGWHLLGNPFPSPLDWSTMTLGSLQNLQDVDGAVYVFQSSGPYVGSYRTYLAGAPGNSSPLIPAGSGFFVHTTSPATPGLVRFNANNRVTTFGAQPAFGRGSGSRPVLTLALAGPTQADAVTLYLDPAATTGVDAAYDAVKLPNPSGLNLAVLASSTPLALDGRPAPTTTTVLPLTLAVPAAGPYVLRVDELANFTALPVYLRDAQAGTEQPLTPGYTVSLTLATGRTSRFSLVLRPAGALATAGPTLAAQASVYPNPAHGAFTLTLPPVAGATKATATLFNALGQVVSTRTLALTAGGATASYATAGLAAGVYALRLTAGPETATLRVVVE